MKIQQTAPSISQWEEDFVKRWIADGAYICPVTKTLTDFMTCKSISENAGCKDIKVCEAVKKHLDALEIGENNG